MAYLHEWGGEAADEARSGGRFLYWDTAAAAPKAVSAVPLTGVAVDGSKLVHAAEVFEPAAVPPPLDKSRRNALRYDAAADAWTLTADGEPVPGARAYRTSELRISLVYRARCFASVEERARFASQRRSAPPTESDDASEEEEASARPESDMLPLEGRGGILDRLILDLVARGRVPDRTALDAIPRLDLALTLISEYTAYPLSTRALLPWNYCATAGVAPAWAQPAFDWLCGPDPARLV